MAAQRLVILSGLPGVGKTTLARAFAKRAGAVHVRIDTIEQAIRNSGLAPLRIDDAGYLVGYALAEDNLRVGNLVIADSVNAIALTRQAWRDVAQRAGCRSIDVEIVCLDQREHQHRIVERSADIAGHVMPTWQDVLTRACEPWSEAPLVIDTAGRSIDATVAELMRMAASQD